MNRAAPTAALSTARHSSQTTEYDTTPESALEAIKVYEDAVLVDFDETLYLRNSTEDFIDSAVPGVVALILLRLLDALKPWIWTGGESTRDVWRVQLVRLCFPWTMARWKRRASRNTKEFSNQPLLRALRAKSTPPVIVTIGFIPIVKPLMDALSIPDAKIVASRSNSFRDRSQGKLKLVTDALGESTVRRSLVLTDAVLDLPLLRLCARPLRTIWPNSRYQPALSRVYLPGQYISQIKRPGEHYFRRAVLQEDYLLWVMSSIAISSSPIYHATGLLLLLCSFWSVYEAGYMDNDRIAAIYEKDPVLTTAYYDAPIVTPLWKPWLWALSLGAGGIYLLRRASGPTIRDLVLWTAALVATYLWFLVYNRANKASRVWLYPGLQFARAAAFVVLVPLVPIGAMALGVHIQARWAPYYIYRMRGKAWPGEVEFGIARLTAFVILSVLLGVSAGWSLVFTWTTAALIVWNLLKARMEFQSLFAKFGWLDRNP